MSTTVKLQDKFIKAGSLEGLLRLMNKLDRKYGVIHTFKDRTTYVGQNGKLVFVAWYEPTRQQLQDDIDDNAK